MGCWCGYLSGASCRLFAYGPADATAVSCLFTSRLVLCFWYRLTQVVLEKRPLNGCSSTVVIVCTAERTHFRKCTVFAVHTGLKPSCQKFLKIYTKLMNRLMHASKQNSLRCTVILCFLCVIS